MLRDASTEGRPKVAPGQVWKWQTITGTWREMLVERIQDGPGFRRAFGHHPQGTKRIQVAVSALEKGLHGAELVRVVEGYVHHPVRT